MDEPLSTHQTKQPKFLRGNDIVYKVVSIDVSNNELTAHAVVDSKGKAMYWDTRDEAEAVAADKNVVFSNPFVVIPTRLEEFVVRRDN